MHALRSIALIGATIAVSFLHAQYDLDARLKKLEEQQAAVRAQEQAVEREDGFSQAGDRSPRSAEDGLAEVGGR